MDAIAAGRTPPAGTVCITFDDGYRDNLTVAAPILERYRLPATLFLATGLVERGENQWSDTLHSLSRKDLHAQLLEASHAERMRVLDEFQAAVKAPRLMLDWDGVRELTRRYPRFEIGGHTRDHLDLTRPPRRGARADRGLRRGPAARARRRSRGTSPIPTGAGTPKRARR